jgi:pyrophosphatase PpaX
MTAVRGILFDFDGTLADTTELFRRAFRHTLETHSGSVPPEREWLPRFGLPLPRQLGHYSECPTRLAAMVETFRGYQDEHIGELLTPFPAAVRAVAELRARSVLLGVVTSKHRPGVVRGIELCGLAEHLAEIVTAEDVQHGKPHPDSVLHALHRLGLEPSEAIFVGDSPYDMAAGRAAGTRTAAALWGPFPRGILEAERPDHLLEHPEELLGLVGVIARSRNGNGNGADACEE